MSMETAVKNIIVFSAALLAHPEILHCCFRAIIRQPLNNCEPWTTICAINERIMIVADLHIGLEYELSKAGVYINGENILMDGGLNA